ncbi:MAG: hypothetical protein ACRDO0_20545 [Nocardioidaceae bacterium]
MKRAVAWALGLYLLSALVGKWVESMGVVRCRCSGDCWCRQPVLSAFRWVFPYGHRLEIERGIDLSPMGGGAVATSPDALRDFSPEPEPQPETARSPVTTAALERDTGTEPEPESALRYWLYKMKKGSAKPGAGGDWETDVFSSAEAVEWGGHHSTRSAEVAKTLNDGVSVGDVVVAYQTDAKTVVGYLRLVRIEGPRDERRLFLQPIHRIDPPFPIHEHKAGTSLAESAAVAGSVMLRELSEQEMQDLVRLSGAPESVVRAEDPPGGRPQ